MQSLSANATQAVTQAATDQAAQATTSLAESAALNATDPVGPVSAAVNGVANTADSAGQAATQALSGPASNAPGLGTSIVDPTILAAPAGDPAAAASAGASAMQPAIGTVDPSTTGAILDSGHSLLSTTLVTAAYLCLILGVIFLAVWLLRRYGPAAIARTKGPDNPRLIGRLMLGPKQSVCVVRVHERNLVLGVTEDRINLLAETETPAGRCYEDEDEDDFTRFAEELADKRKDTADGV